MQIKEKRNVALLYIYRPLKNPNQSTTSSKPLPSESSDRLAGLTNQGQLFGLSCKTERGENAPSTPPREENKAISVNGGRRRGQPSFTGRRNQIMTPDADCVLRWGRKSRPSCCRVHRVFNARTQNAQNSSVSASHKHFFADERALAWRLSSSFCVCVLSVMLRAACDSRPPEEQNQPRASEGRRRRNESEKNECCSVSCE